MKARRWDRFMNAHPGVELAWLLGQIVAMLIAGYVALRYLG